MLRFKVSNTIATVEKCISCIHKHYGGVTRRNYTRLAQNSSSVLRNHDTNLNKCHVRDVTLNSNVTRATLNSQLAMSKNRINSTSTTYNDLLAQFAKLSLEDTADAGQFLEGEKVADTKKKKTIQSSTAKLKTTAATTSSPILSSIKHNGTLLLQREINFEQQCKYSTMNNVNTNSPADEDPLTQTVTETVAKLPRGRSGLLENKNLQKIFPQPKYSLNHVFITLSNQYADKSYQLTPRFKALKQAHGNCNWECTYSVKWPTNLDFTAVGTTKQEASTKACFQGLQYLYNNKHITNKNLPIIPGEEEEAKREKARISTVVFKNDVLDNMQGIVQDYEEKMVQHLQHESSAESDVQENTQLGEEVWPAYSQQKKMSRFQGVGFYNCREVKALPISDFKKTIIETINSNKVVIIKGEPGCGKSTRVPQYILEGWANEFQTTNHNCRIIVTQPRRIAAISLAERVASERNEQLGSTIGYQVRLKSNFNRHTGKVLYCTTGILLRRLQTDPSLSDCTHVVLDEAHERDVNTDLLLTLLKGAMDRNPNLKLIVMSATIKAEVFQDYFNESPELKPDESEQKLNAEVIHVPGFTYPVETYFLDNPALNKVGLENTLAMCNTDAPTVVYEDVVKLLKFIHKNKPEGAILVFLPGWDDIIKVKKLLPETNKNVQVLCLHSRMPDREQRLIFHKFPPGVRKIILATNIAETSVTIDDVGYVVDSGIHKEKLFDVDRGINVIDNHWISKASAKQRKGRAGRVQAGEAYLMYPQKKYNEFHDYSLPEIQRTSLTKIVLDSKVYSNNMKASEFLGQLITPPEETAIDCAVDELVELELLDEAENLTSLGRVISDFQLEPKLAKALVNSVIYKCVTPIVDIVTYFSAEMEIFSGGISERDKVNRSKREFSSSSDHLSMMRLMEQWLDHVENDDLYQADVFCRRHNIVDYKLKTLQQLRNIHFDYLHKGLHDCLPLSDDYSDSDELVKAVLLSGVGTILQHRDHEFVKGKLKKKHVLLTRHNHKATISSESVNHKRGVFPTDYLLYINETRSNIRRMTVIRETSLITPLTVLLFKNHEIVIEPDKYENDENLKDPVIVRLEGTQITYKTEREQAILLQKCKTAINAGVDYYIYQLTKGAEYDREVNRIWDEILKKLNTCLKSEGGKISF